ncbi:MAG: 50S ribosomal protein L29 [Candidatus Altiarchaeota archaeon]
MAILRSDEIQGMNDSEMDERLTQLRKELMKIQGVLASGGIPEEVGKAREIKRTIARIKTIKAQKAKAGGKREVSTKK